MENATNENKVNAPAKGAKVFKILGIVFEVILYIVLAFAIFLLVVSIVSKKNSDGAVNLFGSEMRIVVSNSMEHSEYTPSDLNKYDIGEIKVKSMVFIKRAPTVDEQDKEKSVQELNKWCSALKVGDVLTIRYKGNMSSQETITHRLINIEQLAHGYKLTLQGDNRAKTGTPELQEIYTSPDDYSDFNDRYNYIIGKVTGTSKFLGYTVYALRQPVGLALIIIVPCAIIIIWQVVRIVLVLGENKRAKNEEREKEVKSQAAELEELRRKLAEFQGSSPPANPPPSGGSESNGENTADVSQEANAEGNSVEPEHKADANGNE